MDFIWGTFLTGSFSVIIAGYLIKSPDNTDQNFGYKMPSALKNKDTKVEANKYFGRILIIGGIISILLGLILNLLFSVDHFTNDKLEGINILTLIITSKAIAITAMVLTEDHLKKTFDKEGNKIKTSKAIFTDSESN